MGTPSLKVDSGLLRADAAFLQQVATALSSGIGQVESKASGLVWSGSAAAAYGEEYAAWHSAADGIVEVLRELAAVLDESSSNYEAQESANALSAPAVAGGGSMGAGSPR